MNILSLCSPRLSENKISIEDFARYDVASLCSALSKRDHRNVLIPRECASIIEALNNLLQNGDLDGLTAEQRVVITIAVQMRAKREDRKAPFIDKWSDSGETSQ